MTIEEKITLLDKKIEVIQKSMSAALAFHSGDETQDDLDNFVYALWSDLSNKNMDLQSQRRDLKFERDCKTASYCVEITNRDTQAVIFSIMNLKELIPLKVITIRYIESLGGKMFEHESINSLSTRDIWDSCKIWLHCTINDQYHEIIILDSQFDTFNVLV